MTPPYDKHSASVSYADALKALNRAGAAHTPCFFALDYEQAEGLFVEQPLCEGAALDGLCFAIGAYQSPSPKPSGDRPRIKGISPEPLEDYAERYRVIYEGLEHGDTFLANLTLRTPIELSCSGLDDIYALSQAPYKVLLPGVFVCFSPERFVRIRGQEISTYPMKGTIDASIAQAEERLREDYKEHCEHCTIVDLMRNDLSRIAERVRLKRFKYIDPIHTSKGSILQMSSEVVGCLPDDWHERLGTLLDSLLPAGSISGAPKERTCELIRQAEGLPRQYYTGICGYYDGESLDTAVMIRFIEQEGDRFYYRSGGGITINSRMAEEYEECLQKVYLPF